MGAASSRTLIRYRRPYPDVDPDDRVAKKIREARALHDVPPERTLEMGFGMMVFAREFSEAADRARPR